MSNKSIPLLLNPFTHTVSIPTRVPYPPSMVHHSPNAIGTEFIIHHAHSFCKSTAFQNGRASAFRLENGLQ
jgi:hypothetical protein